MLSDPILAFKGRNKANWLTYVLFAIVACFSMLIFYRAYNLVDGDMYTHAQVAGAFRFTDLHTITERTTYPLWHVSVSVLYQLGIPLQWSAALITTIAKMFTMVLVWKLVRYYTKDSVSVNVVNLATFFLMFVTGVRISSINENVYRPIGSPTVWHNPTQITVLAFAILCTTLLMHCHYQFMTLHKKEKVVLPIKTVLLLTGSLLLCVVSKPTYVQALIPASILFFAYSWARHIKQWRYFCQIIFAFLPVSLYFLMQYLYHTGVLVPYTSGVALELTSKTFWSTIRNVLMMNAFPLCALAACYHKGLWKDSKLHLLLLMLLVSAVEAMTLHEIGARFGHGNFFWAGMSVSFLLWIYTLTLYAKTSIDFLHNSQKSVGRGLGLSIATVLLLWHMYSSFYYAIHLYVNRVTF